MQLCCFAAENLRVKKEKITLLLQAKTFVQVSLKIKPSSFKEKFDLAKTVVELDKLA